MKLLKTRAEFMRWTRENDISGPAPTKLPCYAYAIVTSWGMQEEEAHFLYHEDLMRMAIETAESVTTK